MLLPITYLKRPKARAPLLPNTQALPTVSGHRDVITESVYSLLSKVRGTVFYTHEPR